ncbi:GFA family protein [Hoeflea sp. YIM 152468]|uniref:GFA family protein n=1 Tax=Hoeflea sp. YIM 152468 TaxID=3031759 RepID=UPI0023DADBF6|nr:GFA family protein [Hoeflea sp. YIM 152468]MDF1610384.1 GFA family protein [Hoeflea sp. YIM 152468]
MKAAAMRITGGCLCGQTRYEASGPVLFSLLCYCVDCQKASGTGHVPIMGVARSGFTVDGPTVMSTVTGGSGLRAIRNFCANCHSLLFGTPEAAPDFVTIYAGSLDDRHLFTPQKAQFTRTRQAWDSVPAGLPAYQEAAP